MAKKIHQTSGTPVERKILELAAAGDTAALEDSWLELLETPPDNAQFYARFIRAMNKAKAPGAAHNLLIILLDEISGRSQWLDAIKVIDTMAEVWPDSSELRRQMARAFRGLYAGHPNLEQLIAVSKLGKGATVEQALKRFRAFLKLSPGEVYQHATLGEGIVRKLDLPENRIVIDFPSESGRVFTVEGVRDFLKYVPPGHILAQRATNPGKLFALGGENPAGLVRIALESAGGSIRQGELKSILAGHVIPEAAWPAWWARTRNELRADPFIDFDSRGGAHAGITLREEPRTCEEEAEELFFDAEAAVESRIAAAQKLIAAHNAGDAAADDAGRNRVQLAARMLDKLNAEWSEPDRQNRGAFAQSIGLAFLCEDLRSLAPELGQGAPSVPPARELLGAADDYKVLNEAGRDEYALRALALMFERDGMGDLARAARILPAASPRLAQAVWKELGAPRHAGVAAKALRQLFDHPFKNPNTYLWAVKNMLDDGWNHLEEYIPLPAFVNELLERLHEWNDIVIRCRDDRDTVVTARALGNRTRALLQARDYAALRKAAQEMTADQAQRFLQAIARHDALSDTWRSAAKRRIRDARPDLESAASASSAPVANIEGDIHFCTAEAREKTVRDLEHLNTVSIPENAREIEKARADGDLRENAGYHAARENHVLLLLQANQLRQNISMARVYETGRVNASVIGFGVRFQAENLASGLVEDFTVLGRFEADPDKRIISYQSPLMRQFVGRRTGDEVAVTLPDGSDARYRVMGITNALADDGVTKTGAS
ncbi:MAG: GreA/GreB family elongation factor [bacterium]